MPVSLPQFDPNAHLRGFADFDFQSGANSSLQNARLLGAVERYSVHKELSRKKGLAELPDADALRTLAGRIRQHALDHLDYYLGQLVENVRRNGGQVHFAADAVEARQIILGIAQKTGCTRIVKSKSMVSEEVELTRLMESLGMDVNETDLGEFIVQIAHDRPSHIVGPSMHMDIPQISALFEKHLGYPPTDDPAQLAEYARLHLRQKFRDAQLGMTGANFMIAQTGQICVVDNEGNARQSVTTPRVLVTLAGIEKVLPRLADLAVMLKLLARSATGQAMTIYTSLFTGPRGPGEKDGPEEFHLVLLDNGRSKILADPEFRELLRCIRCGACLNACPVFRKVGGHAYGHTYSGPIGAALAPLMSDPVIFHELPQASTLCGACADACPVKINLPRHLINLRQRAVNANQPGALERLVYRTWARSLKSPWMYKATSWLQKVSLRRRAGGTGWVDKAPMMARGWTNIRSLPAPAKKTFHQLWKQRPAT